MWERSSGRLVVLVAVALLVVSAAGGAAGASRPAAQFSSGPLTQQDVATDSIRLIVSVEENGSATWTVQYWTRLDDRNTTDAFESLRRDVEANPENYTDRFASRMRSTVAAAENSTGRQMTASDFGVRAEVRAPPQYGVVAYTFRWDGFAAVEGDTIRVGDAIEGIFLDDRTRLVVEWPAAYAPTQVVPDADERRADAVVWRGARTSFVAGEPSIVLRPASTVTTTAGAGADGGPTATGTAPGDGGSSLPLFVVGVVGVVVVGAAAWYYRGRLPGGEAGASGGEGALGGGDEALGGEEAGTAAESADGQSPEDLLSNEERVLKFVRERGGRVKQQEIVEAFDWTEARTSQIVRDLRDEGELEGFRLGRENVLKVPDADDES